MGRERDVIPGSLRNEIMEQIHASHLSIENCLRRAKAYIYWPVVHEQLKTYIGKCMVCKELDTRQQKEPLHSYDFPLRPWAKVGTDLFSFNNKDYLVTVDYFSNFWEVDHLSDTRSITVIHKLKAHFAHHCVADVVISDNDPWYSSQEFKRYSKEWEFERITSTYLQGNGKAESAVKTAKRLEGKAMHAKSDPYLAILAHRNTPAQGFRLVQHRD